MAREHEPNGDFRPVPELQLLMTGQVNAIRRHLAPAPFPKWHTSLAALQH
tara:strand:+ start:663 stop:812 length:150 start_codon:yes stop_codon:yes gene_type:complete